MTEENERTIILHKTSERVSKMEVWRDSKRGFQTPA